MSNNADYCYCWRTRADRLMMSDDKCVCKHCGDKSYKARLYDARPYLMRGRCCDRCNFRLVTPRRVEIALAYRRGLRRY